VPCRLLGPRTTRTLLSRVVPARLARPARSTHVLVPAGACSHGGLARREEARRKSNQEQRSQRTKLHTHRSQKTKTKNPDMRSCPHPMVATLASPLTARPHPTAAAVASQPGCPTTVEPRPTATACDRLPIPPHGGSDGLPSPSCSPWLMLAVASRLRPIVSGGGDLPDEGKEADGVIVRRRLRDCENGEVGI
jgi:hypothetical protein